MSPSTKHPRAASRRKNPPERRKRHLETFSADDCASTCPVAIRNAEQVDTLFRRMDEERVTYRENLESTEDTIQTLGQNSVKWSRFSWILGSIISVVGSMLFITWTVLSNVDADLRKSNIAVNTIAVNNQNDISVLSTRVTDFMNNHKVIYDSYIRDQNRISSKLDTLSLNIQQLQSHISAIHAIQRGVNPQLYPLQQPLKGSP